MYINVNVNIYIYAICTCTTSIFRTWLILASRQWHKPPQVTIAARTCQEEDKETKEKDEVMKWTMQFKMFKCSIQH